MDTFLTGIRIAKVWYLRRLEGIEIPLSTEKRKHLILTGKNGSGKTSVMDSLAKHLAFVVSNNFFQQSKIERELERANKQLEEACAKKEDPYSAYDAYDAQRDVSSWENLLLHWISGAIGECDYSSMRKKYQDGRFILSYYKADRSTEMEISKFIENIQFQKKYTMQDDPGKQLVKYMVSMKAKSGMAFQAGETGLSERVKVWFDRFEKILQRIFDDPDLKLDFNIETFAFSIVKDGYEPFNFNQMSSGYSAIFDIVSDLLMRTEQTGHDTEGIVLIDEIETHLHLELQKQILPILTELFPRIQFVVSTHSPFVLSSLSDAVIYDLEKGTLVEDGLAGYPYDGIVEGYFHVDQLSGAYQGFLKRYRELVTKSELSDDEYAEIVKLELALDEIPSYLSPDIAAEYSRLKLEFDAKE